MSSVSVPAPAGASSVLRFEERTQRPSWLITLADLSLLLLGFFVFLQASRHADAAKMADGVRQAFGAEAVEPMPLAMPLDLAIVGGFATGSADLPGHSATVLGWVRAATRDPRTTIAVTGITARHGDVDPFTGSADILASDRARAVAELLVANGAIDPARIRINASATGVRPQVTLAVGFTGQRP